MNTATRALRWSSVSALIGLVSLVSASSAGAQVAWGDLVFTGGFSVEDYEGNFSAVTVAVVDSTENAGAAVGEFGARGNLTLLQAYDGSFPRHLLTVAFDAGLRQFAATGFRLRDYAPREWVGRVDLTWQQRVSDMGSLSIAGFVRGRSVEDRPPMPLFLQPGYRTIGSAFAFGTRRIQGVQFDVELDVERSDYEAVKLLSQLDLLDRRSVGVELGITTGREWGDDFALNSWLVRFWGGLRGTEYNRQDSFDPNDPFRRDRSVHIGIRWDLRSAVRAGLGIEGTINRSNSKRPEYDALSLRGEFSTPLPMWDLSLNALAVITGKTYVHDSPFVRLVPGEEADNASLVYVDVNRPLAPNLDGALRLGWARAETDIGDSYYSRLGVTFLLSFRPALF